VAKNGRKSGWRCVKVDPPPYLRERAARAISGKEKTHLKREVVVISIQTHISTIREVKRKGLVSYFQPCFHLQPLRFLTSTHTQNNYILPRPRKRFFDPFQKIHRIAHYLFIWGAKSGFSREPHTAAKRITLRDDFSVWRRAAPLFPLFFASSCGRKTKQGEQLEALCASRASFVRLCVAPIYNMLLLWLLRAYTLRV
jgi:hypothetical protein